MNFKIIQKILTITIIGTISSTLAGLVFFGLDVFQAKSPFFQFIIYGLTGSISFVLFLLKRYRDSAFILIMLFIFEYMWFGSEYPVTHFIYYLSVIICVFMFSKYFFAQAKNIKYSRPLVLSSLLALTFFLDNYILSLIYEAASGKLVLFTNIPLGFFIGLGLGIGIEVSMLIIEKNELDQKMKKMPYN